MIRAAKGGLFGRVLDASRVPVLAYHIPQLTGIPISDELLDLIGDHPLLAGVKDSSGDPSELQRLVGRIDQVEPVRGPDQAVLVDLQMAGAGVEDLAAAAARPGRFAAGIGAARRCWPGIGAAGARFAA